MSYTTEEKRAYKEQKQAEQEALLTEALTALMEDDAWANFVRFGFSNLAKYSFNNALLIYFQKPDASLVRGMKQWAKEKVAVNEDAQPISILAPMFVKVYEDGKIKIGKDGKPVTKLGWFKTVTVYDVSETDAPTVEKQQVMVPVEGDDQADKLRPLEGFARELGIFVKYREDTGTSLGWFDSSMDEIVINSLISPNAQVRVLVHELAHAYGDVNYTDYTRAQAEVIVESATVMALGMLGFDVSKSSIPYIGSWGGKDAVKTFKSFAFTTRDLAKTLADKMGL